MPVIHHRAHERPIGCTCVTCTYLGPQIGPFQPEKRDALYDHLRALLSAHNRMEVLYKALDALQTDERNHLRK